jgi:hypothetical protein
MASVFEIEGELQLAVSAVAIPIDAIQPCRMREPLTLSTITLMVRRNVQQAHRNFYGGSPMNWFNNASGGGLVSSSKDSSWPVSNIYSHAIEIHLMS